MFICPKCLENAYGISRINPRVDLVAGPCDECGAITMTLEIPAEVLPAKQAAQFSAQPVNPAPAGNIGSANPDDLVSLVARNQEQLNQLAQSVATLQQALSNGGTAAKTGISTTAGYVQQGVGTVSGIANKGADLAAGVLQGGVEAVGVVLSTGLNVLGTLIQGAGEFINALVPKPASARTAARPASDSAPTYYREHTNSAREGY